MAADNIVIKQEVTDAMNLEERILEMCKDEAKGVADAFIRQQLPHIDAQQRVKAINRLLSLGKIDLVKQGSELLYRLKDPSSISKVKGVDNQERLVYQIIEEAGNKGIWIRDIRLRSNLLLTQLNKILKTLESRNLIKAVKSVGASKRKVYMLFNLEPDRSVTGGAWYSDQDFESEFVEVLNQQCYKFLQQKADLAAESQLDPILRRNQSYGSSEDVWKFIRELGISKVELAVEDIETILNTLIYDGKVEMTVQLRAGATSSGTPGQVKLYRATQPLTEPAGIMRVPCGVCPVFNQCYDGGSISPSTCVYMKEWMDY
ncbi:DNA-directed RNA polymerase III subunit RPC6-like isoform X2 [Acanthaster planci]|uniref:DNA-directed RNA polymerase III subunit RPC6 n=1 Tax=Acanthaster planci TaxID=133434 RepID=A0A8B7ZKL6_ACAPL|nr:DNA-directed RNA polymerase III subunit RPC6-like isoform X2 [Acanthaster planci]